MQFTQLGNQLVNMDKIIRMVWQQGNQPQVSIYFVDGSQLNIVQHYSMYADAIALYTWLQSQTIDIRQDTNNDNNSTNL